MSSILVVWIVCNQFRLLMFFAISGAYLPESVLTYITGVKLFSFNISFLPFEKLPGIKQTVGVLDSDQVDSYLEKLGLESNSSIVNNISLI